MPYIVPDDELTVAALTGCSQKIRAQSGVSGTDVDTATGGCRELEVVTQLADAFQSSQRKFFRRKGGQPTRRNLTERPGQCYVRIMTPGARPGELVTKPTHTAARIAPQKYFRRAARVPVAADR